MLRATISVCLFPASVAVNAQTQQQVSTAAFDVVSIKPSPEATNPTASSRRKGGPGTPDPGRWTAENTSLSGLISFAYHLRRYEYLGPDWLERAKFDISAKVPNGATRDQLPAMVSTLLADRFHLTFHYESKEIEGYRLIVTKNGPTLKPAVEGLDTPVSAGPTRIDSDGYPELPSGTSSFSATLPDGHSTTRMHRCTMSQFATFLTNEVHGKPVADSTQIPGEFDITLRWNTLSISASPPSPGGGDAAASDVDSGTTIFAAIQRQLGLRLEPQKIPVRVLVVDRADKMPTEN